MYSHNTIITLDVIVWIKIDVLIKQPYSSRQKSQGTAAMMKVTKSGVQPDELDYSLYEQKFQEITSIKLHNITTLTDG